MAWPEPIVQLAFGDSPYGATSWSAGDVSLMLCDGLSIKRGRSDQMSEIRAGTATVTLKNTTRDYDPDNGSSANAGDIIPMCPIRIGFRYPPTSGTIYWQFYGFVEDWRMRYGGAGIGYADLTCVDGFEPLSRWRLGTQATPLSLASDTADVRIDDVLTDAGWPSLERDLATSVLLMQVSTLSDVPALEHLQLVCRSEDGLFFINREGKATFQDRFYRDTPTPVATWGDAADGSEKPWKHYPDTSYGADQVWNYIETQIEGGTVQLAEDTTSQGKYLLRPYSRTGLLLMTDAAALTLAERIRDRHKDPKTRARTMRPNPHVRDTWADVLARDISDCINIKLRTLLGGDMIDLDCFIEGISQDWQRDEQTGAWNLDIEWALSSV